MANTSITSYGGNFGCTNTSNHEPNLLDCNSLNSKMTYLKSQFEKCNKLQASDLDLLIDIIYSIEQCNNNDNNDNPNPEITQNNLFKVVAIAPIELELEIANAINNSPSFEVSETEIVIFEVLINDILYKYGFKLGKGTYGLGSGTSIGLKDLILLYKDGNTIPKSFEDLDASGTINIDLSVYTSGSNIKLNFIENGGITFSNIPKEGTTIAFTITTADGTQTVDLPNSPEYTYFGELVLTQRNKVIFGFAEYTSTGIEVDVFQNTSNVVAPIISFDVNNTNIEIGSDFSQNITISFIPNDAGALISRSLEKNGTEISSAETTAFSETNVVNQFTLQAFVSYAAGQGLSAGTINTALRSITPRYKYWSYSGSTGSSPSISSTVRALTDNGLITGQTIQATIPQGDTEFSIYIPATESLDSVLYVESSNADITANFTETTITVDDAGGTPRSYKKLTQTIGGTGYTAEATYLITLQ